MQIVCPHCTTSYAVNAETFGLAGRTVRCARCKETWLALPEEAATYALAPAAEADAGWDEPPDRDEPTQSGMPVIDSPSISSDLPDGKEYGSQTANDTDWVAQRDNEEAQDENRQRSRLDQLGLTSLSLGPLTKRGRHTPGKAGRKNAKTSLLRLPVACAAMGAMALGLIVWRANIVRLMPQTATFFKMTGMGVNLRGLAFEDVKISTEVVDNKPVLIIEGNIVDVAKRPIEIPRLRFVVRDANGTDIYAWNAVLEQPLLKPGEKAWFKSRLASPPAEGREIAVRFFNKRDLGAGT
jgi:predicted Zn finger-like uncharacterized protein